MKFLIALVLSLPFYAHATNSPIIWGSNAGTPCAYNLITGACISAGGGGAATSVLATDGSAGAPSISFAADTNTGIYRIGADDMSFVAGGFQGIEIKKSTGNFANVGMGGAASTSDQLPLAIERDNTSAGTYATVSNTSTTANSYGGVQVKGDNGNVSGNFNAYTASATVDAFINRVGMRADGNATGISFMALGAAPYDFKFYHNGGATTDVSLKINNDKSLQFMQEIATPANPSAGSVKMYAKSDNKLYSLTSAGVETALGGAAGGANPPETVVAGGTCSTSYNVNPTNGSMVNLTLNGACAIGVTSLSAGHSFTIKLSQTSTVAPTFTAAYKWQSAVVPTWSAVNGKFDTIACVSLDGTTLQCSALIDLR